MNGRLRHARGRADPFGLLVLAVMFALVVTIGIQAQASVVDESDTWSLFPKAALLDAHDVGSAGRRYR